MEVEVFLLKELSEGPKHGTGLIGLNNRYSAEKQATRRKLLIQGYRKGILNNVSPVSKYFENLVKFDLAGVLYVSYLSLPAYDLVSCVISSSTGMVLMM